MKYNNITKAKFKTRPNRFIAICDIDGREEICHVKNTGRCRELLIPGTTVYLEENKNPQRKTKYDLISVQKGTRLFNIDSQAPNRVAYEWLKSGGLFDEVELIKPECKFKNSRFDFYIEANGQKVFIEVKGVTLEEDGVLLFPDAPTERGVKHINELISARESGYGAYILFIVQTDGAKYFTPNIKTHPEFGEALKVAVEKGVKVLCYTCKITPHILEIDKTVEIKL